MLKRSQVMLPHVVFMCLILLHSPAALEIRQHVAQESHLVHESDRFHRFIRKQYPAELVADALFGYLCEQIDTFRDRYFGFRLNREAKFRGKTHCPEHPERIFGKTVSRLPHRPYYAFLEVFFSVVEIDKLSF